MKRWHVDRRPFWLGFALGLVAGVPLIVAGAAAVFLRFLHERP